MITRNTNRLDRVAAPTRSRLHVLHGPEAGLAIDIPRAGLVLGASAVSDVTLTDPSVSSRHCSVRPTAHGFEVSDLGSTNGTVYDGAQITRASVPAGAVLALGATVIQLLPDEEAVVIPPSAASRFGGLVGSSLPMRQIYGLLERASASNAPMLLLGESGTGKEVCARAVHDSSPRSKGPFVIFDCGAASESLLESDLFGHVRGAFTGADRERAGAFALAHGGTLFLDEIGDLPLRLQPKLLRLLETGTIQPLGAGRQQAYDVRVVAATHRDLRAEVDRGSFRGDVYYRLAVVEVHLPPLRERLDDVPELVHLFLERDGVAVPSRTALASKNLDRLRAYTWPGNVRELRNAVARAVALAPKGAPFAEMPVLVGSTSASPRAPEVRADRPFSEAKAELVEQFERAYLRDLFANHGDNLSEAARIAGIERKHLYRLMARLGITT